MARLDAKPLEQMPAHDAVDLHAFNSAFWDLGFKWQWDDETYRELGGLRNDKARIRAYLEQHQPHLLKAYDPDFLVDLIHESKARRRAAMIAARERGEPLDLSCNGVKGAH